MAKENPNAISYHSLIPDSAWVPSAAMSAYPCQHYKVVVYGHVSHDPNAGDQPQRDEGGRGDQQCGSDCEHRRSSIVNDAIGLGHIGASVAAEGSRVMGTL